jgi:hypothetical protein
MSWCELHGTLAKLVYARSLRVRIRKGLGVRVPWVLPIMTFKDCPRCGAKYNRTSDIFVSCSFCRLHYYCSTTGQTETLTLYNILNKDDMLVWSFTYGRCMYGKTDPVCDVKLPWLPYNITAAKLKLLLLFT